MLVPKAQLARLARLSRHVPFAASALGVECRLRGENNAVDLGAACVRAAATLEWPSRANACHRVRQSVSADPCWQAIDRFFRLWSTRGSASSAWIPFVFLEYDSDGADPPVPSVFAALDSPVGVAPTRGCPEAAAAHEFARILLGDELRDEQVRAIDACFGAMRGRTRILHVAAMLGRLPRSVRISLSIPESEASEYFRRVGASAPATELAELVAALPTRTPDLQLDFDLGPPLAPRIGLGHRPEDRAEWEQLLDHLVERGRCDAGKAAALLRWVDERVDSRRGLRRELSHIKLIRGTGGDIEAKCYLGISLSPRSVGGEGAESGAGVLPD